MLRRADIPEFWQSITGSMEWSDEQPAETAARELREETGIVAAPAQLTDWHIQKRYVLLPEFRYKYAPGVTENTEHFFSLELPAECPVTVAPDEHLEYDSLIHPAPRARGAGSTGSASRAGGGSASGRAG